MQKRIKLAVGAAGGVVVAAGVVIITASATGLHLAGSAQPAPVTATSPAPAPSSSPQRRSAANPAARTMNQAAAQAEAQVLGIQPEELAADLRKGTTVHMLADQVGISQADFQTRFQAGLKTLLDQQVQQGTLTAQQEQQFLKRTATRIPNWDQVPKRPTPTPTPTPTS